MSRLYLAGFASTALFGPVVGRMCDAHGRRAGTIASSLLCGLGACSTLSDVPGVLILGRLAGGVGSSLLHCAPESWLVGEAGRRGMGVSSLSETFGLAYAGDSIVAILAGQMAEAAASSSRGPTGPFELSVAFLALGGLLASFLWKENVAGGGGGGGGGIEDDGAKSKDAGVDVVAKPSIRDAIEVVKSDPKIMLVGAIQSMFEAAMYIFVLNWPPAVSRAIESYFSKFATANSSPSAIGTPYGTVFSCFMACCLLGSTVFGRLTSSTGGVDARTGKVRSVMSTESFAVGMLALATTAMGFATLSIGSSAPTIFGTLTSLPILSTVLSPVAAVWGNISTSMSSPGVILSVLMLSLFLFESCVGMYFPTIGTLRSKYFSDSHRSVMMNLFGIPLNAMVVTAILSMETLGVHGCLGISTAALAVATACGLKLKELVEQEVEGEKGGESMSRVS